jgi:hypothetical protein
MWSDDVGLDGDNSVDAKGLDERVLDPVIDSVIASQGLISSLAAETYARKHPLPHVPWTVVLIGSGAGVTVATAVGDGASVARSTAAGAGARRRRPSPSTLQGRAPENGTKAVY